jgi:hypothetical protein
MPIRSQVAPAFLPAVALVAACSAGPDGGADDRSDGSLSAGAAAHIVEHGQLKGELSEGEREVAYTGKPEFWLFEFTASVGDQVVLTASSTDGDPILWLLDEDLGLVAKNDDAYVLRLPATFTLALAGTSSPDPEDLEEFLAGTAEEKLERLYSEFREIGDDFSADLSTEFSQTALQITDEIEGPPRQKLLNAFFALRDDCFDHGATAPDVSALRKGGLIYAVEMTCVEDSEDVEWAFLQTLDASGSLLGSLGKVGF